MINRTQKKPKIVSLALHVVPFIGLFMLSGCASQQAERTRGAALAQSLLMVDTHIDVPFRLHKKPANLLLDNNSGEFDVPKAQRGGLNAAFMSIYIPASVDAAGEATELADQLIDSMEAQVRSAPSQFALAYCSADVTAAQSRGAIALPLGMENGGPIAGQFALLTHFRERGIRYITLAHSKSNHISDSSYDAQRNWGGLSPFGVDLVTEMNVQGVMIDVSHLSDAAFWQVLQLSSVPVIASHSSLRHFTPNFERNMSDAMVTALGTAGGVVQINFGSSFLTQAAQDWGAAHRRAVQAFVEAQEVPLDDPRVAEFSSEYRQANPYAYANLDNVLDHIDRAVELAGIDAVGLGSDFDGVGDSLPIGLKDAGDYPNLIDGLIERGYDDQGIEKILGGNLMRVWQATEAYAQSQGTELLCAGKGYVR